MKTGVQWSWLERIRMAAVGMQLNGTGVREGRN